MFIVQKTTHSANTCQTLLQIHFIFNMSTFYKLCSRALFNTDCLYNWRHIKATCQKSWNPFIQNRPDFVSSTFSVL